MYLMHRICSSFLWWLQVCLSVMKHDVLSPYNAFYSVQKILVVQKPAKHCVMVLQVVDAFHLENNSLMLNN